MVGWSKRMVNYWVFFVNDWINDAGRKFKGKEVFDILQKNKIWGIGNRTPNRKRLSAGDKVVFYLAGSEGQKFLGKGSLNSPTISFTGDIKYSEDANIIVRGWENLVVFNEFEAFKEPKLLEDMKHNLEFVVKKEIATVYFQSGVRSITKEDYEALISEGLISISQKGSSEGIENENQFILEKYLQSFIVENWHMIKFDKNLKIFEDDQGNNGAQYTTDVGYIDILSKDNDGNFVVIELKKGRESDKVVGQILRYMGWVREHLAISGQKVEGVIICNEYDKKMDYAVSMIPNISIKKYAVSFSLV
tara:strand:+ start:1007 stop:1921 length:915 start_codon:yes stop_codon:yes gene_type:complete